MTELTIKEQAKCFRFLCHPDYQHYGPYNTHFDWVGHTVCLSKSHHGKAYVSGTGATCAVALAMAVRAWNEHEEVGR